MMLEEKVRKSMKSEREMEKKRGGKCNYTNNSVISNIIISIC